MNEKLYKLYDYIKSQGATDLTLEQFYAAYGNDPVKAKNVYDYVRGNNMTDLSESDFFNAYFGSDKKKEPTVSDGEPIVSTTTSATDGQKKETQRSAGSGFLTQLNKAANTTPVERIDKRESIFEGYSPGKAKYEKYTVGYVSEKGKSKYKDVVEDTPGKKRMISDEGTTYEYAQDKFGNWYRTDGTKYDVKKGEKAVTDIQAQMSMIPKDDLDPDYSETKWEKVDDVNELKRLDEKFDPQSRSTEEYDKYSRNRADMLKINSSFMDQSDNDVAEKLNNSSFSEDFIFEPAGLSVNAIRVTTRDGLNSQTFYTSDTYASTNAMYATKLQQFLTANQPSKERSEALKAFESDVEGPSEYDKRLSEAERLMLENGIDISNLPQDSESTRVSKVDIDVPMTAMEDIQRTEKAKKDYKTQYNYLYSLIDGDDLSDKERADRLRASIGTIRESAMDEFNKDASIYLNDIDKSVRYNSEFANRLSERANEIKEDIANNGYITDEQKKELQDISKSMTFVQDNIESLSYQLSTVTDLEYDLEEVGGIIQLQKEKEGSFAGNFLNEYLKGATIFLRGAGMPKDQVEALVEYLGDPVTTREYASSEDRTMLEKGLSGLASSLGVATTSLLAGPLGKYASYLGFYELGYYEMMDEINENPNMKDIPDSEKQFMSAVYGMTAGMLERFGLMKMISKNPAGKKIPKLIMSRVFKSLPKNATEDVIELAIKNDIKKLLAQKAINIIGTGIVEYSTEAAQEADKIAIQEIYDAYKGEDFFKNGDAAQITGRVNESGVLGIIGSGVLSTTTQSATFINESWRKRGVSNELAQMIKNVSSDAAFRSTQVNYLKSKVVSGEITAQQAKDAMVAYDEMASRMKKIPEDVKDVVSAYDLITEKQRLEKEMEGMDKALVANKAARVAEINSELESLTKTEEDAVQEQAAGKVPVQPEAKVGEEVEEGAPTSEPQVVTEEGKKIAQSDYAKSEVARVKELPIESEDGATMNLDGTKYEGGGLVVPLASKNMKASELTAEEIDAFVAENSESIGADNVKIGIYKFPNSDQVSIDLNIVADPSMREEALAIGKELGQESLFDLDTFENVKTGETGLETKTLTPKEFVDIQTRLTPKTEKSTTDKGISETTLANEITLDNRTEFTDRAKPENKSTVRAANAAVKALNKLGVRIFLHNNTDEYNQAIADSVGTTKEAIDMETDKSNGEFIVDKNEIHINLENADAKTVFHEAFHALVKAKGFTVEDMKTFVSAVKKSGNLSQELSDRLDDFAEQYSSDSKVQRENLDRISKGQSEMSLEEQAQFRKENPSEIDEEFLSELIGDLSATAKTMNRTQLQKLADAINALFSKIGLGNPLSKTADRKEIIDFLNGVSTSLREGREISGLGVSYDNVVSTRKMQANFSHIPSGFTFVYIKNDEQFEQLKKDGYITEDKTMNDFSGLMMLHAPDAAFSGIIYKEGEVIVDGKGGIYYPIKFHDKGYFWASTEKAAQKMARDLNEMRKNSPDGKIKLALVSAPIDKLMSSSLNSIGLIDILTSKAFDEKSGITETQVKRAIAYASKVMNDMHKESIKIQKKNEKEKVKAKKEGRKPKVIGYKEGIKPNQVAPPIIKASDDINDIKTKMLKFFAADVSAFPMRKAFNSYLLDGIARNVKSQKTRNQVLDFLGAGTFNPKLKSTGGRLSKANLKEGFSNLLAEPTLKQEESGKIYAVIEIDGDVKPVKTNDHESYPFAMQSIDSNKKVTLHILKDRVDWMEHTVDPETGEAVIEDVKRADKILPPSSGVSKAVEIKKVKRKRQLSDRERQIAGSAIEQTDKLRNLIPENIQQKSQILTGRRDPVVVEYRGEKVPISDYEHNRTDLEVVSIYLFQDRYKNLNEEQKLQAELWADAFLNEYLNEEIDSDVSMINKFPSGDFIQDFFAGDLFEAAEEARRRRMITIPTSRKKHLSDNGKKKAIDDAKAKYELSKKRGNSEQQAIDAAINDLKKNDWYNESSDVDREAAIRQLRKELGLKEKSAPSVQKLGLKPKRETQTKSVNALRKEFIEAWNRAYREGGKSEKKARENLANRLNEIVGKIKGMVKGEKLKTITNRALKMNLSNPVMADRFADYVVKTAKDAEYGEKLTRANKIKKSIRKAMKSKDALGNNKTLAKMFLSIDPKYSESIDEYIEYAEKVLESLDKTKVARGELSIRQQARVDKVNEFIEKSMENQDKIKMDMIELSYPELFESKALNRDMTPAEAMSIIQAIDFKQGDNKISEKKLAEIRSRIGSAIDSLAAYVEEMISTGVDPISGEKVSLSKAEIKVMKDLIAIDQKNLSIKQMFTFIDLLQNAAINQETFAASTFIEYVNGDIEAKSMQKKHGKMDPKSSRTVKTLSVASGVTLTINTILGGVNKGAEFMLKSGFDAIRAAKSKATTIARNAVGMYDSKFNRKKPNGKSFDHIENRVERGMYAFIIRSINGSSVQGAKEFSRRLKLLRETVLIHESPDADQSMRNKAEVIRKVADKLGIFEDGVTEYDIISRVDKTNTEAVQYWIDKFAEHFEQMSDVSKSIYNKELSADINYTPDSYRRIDLVLPKDIDDQLTSMMNQGGYSRYDMESSSLTTATRPNALPSRELESGKRKTTMYIDLDFDYNVSNAFQEAMIDVYTARPIKRFKGFIDSDAFESMVSNADNRKVLLDSIESYIMSTRGVSQSSNDRKIVGRSINKIATTVSTIGGSVLLGGMDQLLKQTVSMIANTGINSFYMGINNGQFSASIGGLFLTAGKDTGFKFSVVPPVGQVMTKSFNNWLRNNGVDIEVFRGAESMGTIDPSKFKATAETRLESVLDNAEALSRMYVDAFLVSGDKVVAKSAFLMYYNKYMVKNGMAPITDFSKPMNEKARAYALSQVSKQQGESDADMNSALFSSDRNLATRTLVKILLPLSSFIINKKASIVSDLFTLGGKKGRVTAEDRSAAFLSLSSSIAEITVYSTLSIMLRAMIYNNIAAAITGYDEEEEDKFVNDQVKLENKRRDNKGMDKMSPEEERAFRRIKLAEKKSRQYKGELYTNLTKDLSPLPPIFDYWYLSSVEKGREYLQENITMTDEIKKAIKEKEELDGEEMSEAKKRAFTKDYLQYNATRLMIFENDGLLGSFDFLGDQVSEDYELMKADITGEVESYRGDTKYLTDTQKETVRTLAYMLAGSKVLPKDLRKVTVKSFRNIKKMALTATQYDRYQELKKIKGGTDEEITRAAKKFSDAKVRIYKAISEDYNEKDIPNDIINMISNGMSEKEIRKEIYLRTGATY